MSADPIPVSVLTGFLGSGKTTMLRHLLKQPEFSRTAVIINEFGEVGIDHELIEASEDSFIELQTGCLCCKIRSDLAQTYGVTSLEDAYLGLVGRKELSRAHVEVDAL